MKVKVRRAYFNKAEGQTREGQILEMSEGRYRQLSEGIHLLHPLVDPVDVGYKMEPAPKNKMQPPHANKEAAGSSISFRRVSEKDVSVGYREEAAKKGPADPTSSPLDGGQTGEVSAALFSEPDQAPARRRSRKRETEPESSPSTDPGN